MRMPWVGVRGDVGRDLRRGRARGPVGPQCLGPLLTGLGQILRAPAIREALSLLFLRRALAFALNFAEPALGALRVLSLLALRAGRCHPGGDVHAARAGGQARHLLVGNWCSRRRLWLLVRLDWRWSRSSHGSL
jgi:hypothetical protein